MKLHLLAGMPGSGKSTTAQGIRSGNKRTFVISSDEIRVAINSGRYPSGNEFPLIDPVVWKLVRTAVTEFLKIGCDVILDATNLTIEERAFTGETERTLPNTVVRSRPLKWRAQPIDSSIPHNHI